ncbi:MAG: hypothetical protein AAGA08_02350 [Pseudomonadota bacterium]
MTNRIAIVLGLTLIMLLILNATLDWQAHIFLGRKLVDLIEYLAFWR